MAALEVIKNQPLDRFSTFGIGGQARYFAEVRTREDLSEAFHFCKKEGVKSFILGKGSNVLFDEKGFDGVVILNKIDFSSFSGERMTLGAGYSFSLLGTQTARKGLSGLEFASGIPGSVGGAVFMNAGANGAETKDCLFSVEYLSEEGDVLTFHKEELSFGYRYSSFQQMKGAIVAATFSLRPSATAREKQIEIINYRKKTQPYGQPSAGCAFRNPKGDSAGRIIDSCGLKGLVVGGAKISELHGNFIVNKGGATSKDVLELISLIKNHVKDNIRITLEEEIRYIPY